MRLGIRLAAFWVDGGIFLLLIGIAMLLPAVERYPTLGRRSTRSREMIGAVPLGIPLLVGPGSISVAILAASQDRDWLHLALLSIIAVAVAALARLALVFADRVASALGRTGVNIASRLMGIFSRHATEFIATGLVELFPILGARPGSAVH